MQPDFSAILKQYWGFDEFRELQLEAIQSVYDGRDSLVLMPTGGGKSIVYQIPAMALEGVCVVITPLISLMKDQVDKLRSKRILAESIHGGMLKKDIDRILDNCVYGDVKFLFISPERIDSELFRMRFAKMPVSLITVDEAHCISQWGYDFRPAYLKIARLRELQPDPPVLALTASATPDVCRDIMQHLGFRKEQVFRMDFGRKNLSFLVRQVDDKYEQMMRIIGNVPGTGIVYVRTRERAEQVAQYLCENGVPADFYHGGLGFFLRNAKQDRWIKNETRVMVATNAFGMGIDKADVRFVIHFDLCDSIEAYYQEAGRAGRDGRPAYAVLLLSEDEKYKAGKRIQLEFPSMEQIRRIYEGVFNFFQIAIGDGKGQTQAINAYDLSTQLKVFTPTLLNALKILQQNGYMSLTEEMDLPARIRFIVQRDELYRIRVLRRELDHLITVLLRQYSGLFSDFVPIDELQLAQLSGYTVDHVKELLKKLWQLHIIKYIPGGKTPLLQFTEERLPISDLVITPESYSIRKETTLKRVEAMFEYAYCTDRCRSVLMQQYFGQDDARPCGKCDYCRSAGKSGAEANSSYENQITELMAEGDWDIKKLVTRIPGEADEIIRCITALIASGKIIDQKNGKLRLNR